MTTIFVSYSHLDRKWCDPKATYPLIPWLETALRRDGAALWYDRSDETGLLPGAQFEAAILEAIDASQVALLLISEAFFASDFIREVELPRILQRAETDGLVVIPILLEPCDWQSFEYVASRQMLPGEPTPLINYTGSDREWVYARDQVLSGIRRRLREQAGPPTEKPRAPTPAPADTSTRAPLPAPPRDAPVRQSWTPYGIAALVVLALVMSVVVWRPWEKPAAETRGETAAILPNSPGQTVILQSPTPPMLAVAPTAAPSDKPTAAPKRASSTPTKAANPTAIPPTSTPTPNEAPAVPLAPGNAASLKPLIHRSQDDVRQLVWLPDGKVLMSLLSDSRIYDPATGREQKIYDRGYDVLAVGKDAQGKILIATADYDKLQLWDAESGGEVATLPELKGAKTLAFSPDGALLAAGINEAVKLVEIPSGREVDTLLGVVSTVYSVAFSPDGQTLAAGGQSVMLWNVADRRELANFRVAPWVKGLAFSPDGKLLAIGSRNGLELYDPTQITSAKPRMVRKVSEDTEAQVAWSPDGALLAWTSPPALVKLWDVAGSREVATLKGHTTGIVSLGFSPDGTRLATGTRDGMRLWGASADGPAASPEPPAAGPLPTSVPLSPNAITAANAGQVTQIDLWEQKIHSNGTLAWAPDSAWLACCSAPVRIYDVAARQARDIDTNYASDALAVAPIPEGLNGDGPLLVAAGYQGIQLWDAASGGQLSSFPAIRDVESLALSPDGSLLAAGAMEAVKLLATADGREIDTLLGVVALVQSLAFSPDGKVLAAGGQNIITWELPGGRELANIRIDAWATRLIFAPDGTTLVAAIRTGVRVYEAPGLRLVRSIGEEEPTALALAPDGTLLAWAARTTPIRLVDLTNGREVATLTGHTGVVQALAFSPDGARLASGSDDGTIRLWEVGQ